MIKDLDRYLLVGALIALYTEFIFWVTGGIPKSFGQVILFDNELWSKIFSADLFIVIPYLPVIFLPIIIIIVSLIPQKIKKRYVKENLPTKILCVLALIFIIGCSIFSIQYLPLGLSVVAYFVRKAFSGNWLNFFRKNFFALFTPMIAFFLVVPEHLSGLGFFRRNYFDGEFVPIIWFWLTISTIAYIIISKVQSHSKWFLILVVPLVVLVVGFLFFAMFFPLGCIIGTTRECIM